jgi:hypothetical protein
MKTFVGKSVIILSACLAFCSPIMALEQGKPEPNTADFQKIGPLTSKIPFELPPEKIFSPSVSRLFYDTAYELAHRKDITSSQAQQAIILFNAAMDLDVGTDFAAADIITIESKPGPARNLQTLYDSLINYVGKNPDYQVASNAVRYLFQQLNSRRQREILLGRLIRDIGESNPALKSELATSLGLLYAEKADDPNAAKIFAAAYIMNKYNQLAFEKLIELVPEQVNPVWHLEYLRLKLRDNPLDIDTAIAFAQYAQRLQLYDVASGSFQYCADLFGFLYPGRDVPAAIYASWMQSWYNAPRNLPKCLQLAEEFRKQGRFDLQIEVLAAKAAAKTGDANMADDILKSAEQKAIELVRRTDQPSDYKPLAWFYLFVRPDPERAIDYANKAYSAEPNSPLAAALLGCAFVDNNEPNLAKPLLDNFPQTQIAAFARAKLQLAAGQKQSAIDLFRAVVDMDPGSLVAEQARLLLSQQQAEYIPIYDTGIILSTLKQTVGEQLVPQFIEPDKMLSFQLNIHGNRFSYGNDFDGSVSITNNWYEPLVISDDSLCRGKILIDVNVTGDLQARIAKLVTTTTRPTSPIEPGRIIVIPVRLYTGPLRQLLIGHPQASLNLQFTAYLDPVETGEGEIVSAIPGIKPATIQIERPRVEITTEFLQNRLNSMSKGKQGPKVKAVQLFAGLLMENREVANRPLDSTGGGQPPYKLVIANWMPPLLKSALTHGLTDNDWVIKAHSMAAIADLPLDYELINAAAQGLNDQYWPARMMALWMLAQRQSYNFSKVLDHAAQYDDNAFVRDMAVALGANVSGLEKPLLELHFDEPNTAGR